MRTQTIPIDENSTLTFTPPMKNIKNKLFMDPQYVMNLYKKGDLKARETRVHGIPVIELTIKSECEVITIEESDIPLLPSATVFVLNDLL